MRKYPPTPGPWSANSGQVVDARGNVIASRHSYQHLTRERGDITPTEADSNTILMAAAPELRDALVEMLDAFDPYAVPGVEKNVQLVERVTEILKKVSYITEDERMSEAMRYDPEYQEHTGFARNH